jgi:TatD DNase family protein
VLFDTHCHLTDRSYGNPSEVIKRAQDAGVQYLLSVGLDRSDCAATVKLAGEHANLYAAVGIHPHEADRFQPDDIDFLRELSRNPKVRAIGETGLDFFRDYADHENQRRAFHAHIALAQELGLPMVLHIRDAYPEARAILNEHGYYHGVMHCYSGDRAFALEAVQLGCHVSFAGSLTFAGSRLPEAARALPVERILVETDAPYLTPVPYRGRMKNEPALVRFTLEALARIRNLPVAEMARTTTENGKRLFRIGEKGDSPSFPRRKSRYSPHFP